MDKFLGYKCSLCGQEYGPGEITYTCLKDGGNLDVILDFTTIRKNYRPEDILTSAEPSLWRYLPLLPVFDPGGIGTPLRAAGWTPLYSPDALAKSLGVDYLWVKDESRNPTASFKDRASAVVVGRAREVESRDCRHRLHRKCWSSSGRHVGSCWTKGSHFCAEDCSTSQSGPTAGLRRAGDAGRWYL